MLGWKSRTPAKTNAWLVENKGNPKKEKHKKGELILGKNVRCENGNPFFGLTTAHGEPDN